MTLKIYFVRAKFTNPSYLPDHALPRSNTRDHNHCLFEFSAKQWPARAHCVQTKEVTRHELDDDRDTKRSFVITPCLLFGLDNPIRRATLGRRSAPGGVDAATDRDRDEFSTAGNTLGDPRRRGKIVIVDRARTISDERLALITASLCEIVLFSGLVWLSIGIEDGRGKERKQKYHHHGLKFLRARLGVFLFVGEVGYSCIQ